MFERSNKTVNILIIVVGVLSTLLIGILFFSNMRQNELNEELNRRFQEKLNLMANKPLPRLECPECPKVECPKQADLKCPEVPSCPPCPTMNLDSMKPSCPKCPTCPTCPTCPKIKVPEIIQKPIKCPPQKACPAPKICPQPRVCPPPRRCPSVRVVQKPCPRDEERFPSINEIMAKDNNIEQSTNTGNYYPFIEMKGLCPVKSSSALTTLSYLPSDDGSVDENQVGGTMSSQALLPRGIQLEEQQDITQGPLLSADFTGNNQDISEESEPQTETNIP